MIILAGLVTALMVLATFGAFFLHFQMNINTAAFMAQIQKLVMANNIDRAVKLCNAAPDAPLSKAAKVLLVRANRPYQYELAFQEALLVLRPPALRVTTGHSLAALLGFLSYITLGVGFAIFGLDANDGIVIAMGATTILASLFTTGVLQKLRIQLTASEQYLLKLRNLLYSRLSAYGGLGDSPSGYVPPSLRPMEIGKANPDYVAEWRAWMEEFEAGFMRGRDAAKKAGEPELDVMDEHEQADADRVQSAL